MKLFQPPKSFVVVLIAGAIPALCSAQDNASPTKTKEKPAKLTPEELKIAKPSGIPSPIALFKAFDDIKGIDWQKAAAEIAKEPALERPFVAPFFPVFPAIALIISVITLITMIYFYLNLSLIFFAGMAIVCLVFRLTGKHKVKLVEEMMVAPVVD